MIYLLRELKIYSRWCNFTHKEKKHIQNIVIKVFHV